MTTEIRDGRYMSGLWFLQGLDMDWLGVLWQDKGKPFTFEYRFRYYRDNLVTPDTTDIKQFFVVSFLHDDTEQFCIEVVKAMIDQLLRSHFSVDRKVTYVPLRTDRADEVMSVLSKIPEAHVSTSRGAAVAQA